MKTVTDIIFLSSKITANGDCSHKIKRCLLHGRKAMTNLVLVAQSCLTLCDLKDCSLPGSSVHAVLQARILEWVAIPFSRDLPDPEMETTISCIAGDSLPSEPTAARRGHWIRFLNPPITPDPETPFPLWIFLKLCDPRIPTPKVNSQQSIHLQTLPYSSNWLPTKRFMVSCQL